MTQPPDKRLVTEGTLPELAQDIVAAMVKAGTGIATTYDDNSGTLTLSTVGAVPTPGSGSSGGTIDPTTLIDDSSTSTGKVWSSTQTSTQLATKAGAVSLTPTVLSQTAANTAVVLDNFTGADGTALTAHTPDTGTNPWTAVVGTFTLSGNKLIPNSTADGDIAVINAGSRPGHFTLTCSLTPTTDSGTAYGLPGLVFSYTDSSNFFYLASAATSPTNWTLYRVTGGTTTMLLQVRGAVINPGSSYLARIDRSGPDIIVSVDDVEFGTVSDTQGITSTTHGVRFGRSSAAITTKPTWDAFQLTPLRGAVYNWPHLNKSAANPVVPMVTTTRTDTVTVTSGSATVADTAIVATDKGRPLAATTGIPSGTYVGTVTAGTSFLLSSSPTSQVNVVATAAATSVTLGTWNGTDLNDPSVAYDPINNRWVMAATGYYDDGTHAGIQTLGIYYAATLDSPWVAEPLNPVLADAATGKYNMNGALVWYLDHWIYACGSKASNGNIASAFTFYTSTDLKTWTKQPNLFQPGASGSFDSAGCYDAFLRVRQDGVTLELWYAGVTTGGGNRKIGMAYSRDGANSWIRSTTPMLNPPLFDLGGFGAGGNYFAEPSAVVPPGKEGKEMLVFFDTSFAAAPTARKIGQAITVDGGATWHYRIASTAGSGWESAQNFDSHPIITPSRFYLFFGGANVAGSALNLNIQIGQQVTEWNSASLLVSPALSTVAVVTIPLANTVAPVISGTAVTGSQLTVSTGTWSATPEVYAYQWYRAGASIAGATGPTYTVTSNDVGQAITATVTATKTGYSTATVSTGAVTPTAATFMSSTAPTITGTATQGQTLTASTGTWSVTPDSYMYQWNRAGAAISGATSSIYQLVAADVGNAITVTVTAIKAGYTNATAISAATANVTASATPALSNTVAPAVSPTSGPVGTVLTVTTGTWSASPDSYTYQWVQNGSAISGATSSTYTTVSGDVGTTITCTVTAVKSGYTSGVATSNGSTVQAAASTDVGPTLTTSGTPAFTAGKFANAFDTTGGSGYRYTTSAALGGSTQTSWTLEGWIKNTAASGTVRVAFEGTAASGTASTIWFGVHSNNLLRFTVGSYTFFDTVGISDALHHVAITSDGTTARFFLDGVLRGSNALGGITLNWTNVFLAAGSSAGANNWIGLVDEVRVSNSPRYTAAFTPATSAFTTDANTVALYHLDS